MFVRLLGASKALSSDSSTVAGRIFSVEWKNGEKMKIINFGFEVLNGETQLMKDEK